MRVNVKLFMYLGLVLGFLVFAAGAFATWVCIQARHELNRARTAEARKKRWPSNGESNSRYRDQVDPDPEDPQLGPETQLPGLEDVTNAQFEISKSGSEKNSEKTSD